MPRTLPLIWATIVLIVACQDVGHEIGRQVDDAQLGREAYAIYSAALDTVSPHLERMGTLVLPARTSAEPEDIGGWTFAQDSLHRQEEPYPDLLKGTWDDFLHRNTEIVELQDSFLIEAPYIFVEPEVLQSTSELNELRDRFGPLTRVSLSRPGLSQDGNQALVHVFSRCDLAMCGAGYYVLLEKDGGDWSVRWMNGSYIE